MENNERNVQIDGDAEGNVVITGSSNKVYIIHSARAIEPETKSTQAAIGPNPYKGLGAFQERDANYFFGREDLTQALWIRFRDLHEKQPGAKEPARILPILGPSGSGKSSLARAGLLPELARRPLIAKQSIRVAVFVPGAHPLESLATILVRLLVKDEMPVAKVREFTDQLRLQAADKSFDGLRRIAAAIPDVSSAPLVILVDQFEEIYSLCDDVTEREIFVANCLTAAKDRSSYVSIIFTLRTDFIGHTNSSEELSRIIASQGVIVPVMNRDELERAIAQPAAMCGHPLDAGTVDLLVNETKEGTLPLLQFALTRIWEGMSEGKSPADTLRKLGGVGGALAGEAQRLYEGLQNESDRALARRAFLSLVRVGTDIPTTRRTLTIDDLVAKGQDVEHVRAVLERFASPGARILTLSANASGDETAKIAHEALIEHWEQFEQWIRTAYDDLLFQYRLEDAARYWDRHARANGLLWRSPDLDRLKAFRKNPERSLTDLQTEFADASEQSARWASVYKIGGLSAGLGMVIVFGVLTFAYVRMIRQTDPKNINGGPQPSPSISEPTPEPGFFDDVEIKSGEMTAAEAASLEKIKQDTLYVVQVLNPLFGKNLSPPPIKLVREKTPQTYWHGTEYVAPPSVEKLPELTYHEVSHYFIGQASNLENWDQPGAINESYADIYAELISQRKLNQTAQEGDWLICPGYWEWVTLGQSNLTGAQKMEPLDSMKAPGTAYNNSYAGKDPQPAHMKNFVKARASDPVSNIYVNKGITNKAFYEAAIKIGTEPAAIIWTAVLPQLSAKATFQELANKVVAEAAKRHGQNSAEEKAVREAWRTVGITAH